MSTNEELVAAASEHLAHNVWDDEIFVLADQLVTALEQVTAERDEACKAAEDHVLDAEATYGRMAEKLRKVTAERDALLSAEELAAEDRGKLIEERDELAAFREAVQGADNEYAHDEDGYSYFRHDVQDALKAAPEVALARVKAEALRDAADGFRFYKEYRYRAVVMLATENYLNERAERIKKGESNG